MIEQSRAEEITAVFNGIRDLVLEKNKRYGDSALSPINIFSRSDNSTALFSRADDKLSRIKNRDADNISINDLVDLAGYLVLIIIDSGYTASDISCLVD